MIVVTGGTGRLARALQVHLPDALYPSRTELDVGDAASCQSYFSRHLTSVIVHLAAITKPAAPSADYLRTNIIGTTHITLWAMRHQARLVYTSTDYVYPGTDGGYVETAPIAPIGRYATSKFGGECAVGQYPNSLILRGSWYDHLLHDRAPTDAFTSRVAVSVAAPWIAQLVRSPVTGIMNLGGPRRSLYEIVQTMNPEVRAITREQVSSPYPFPADTSLDTSKLQQFLRGAS